MMTETKLWAMLIPGPDNVWAMPSKDAAEDAANRHNEAIEAGGFAEKWGMSPAAIAARVIEWPYDAESHADALTSEEPETLTSNELGIPDGAEDAMEMTTREQIIAAAREADPGFGSHTLGGSIVGFDAVERFYAIAFEAGRVAEREECAKETDKHQQQ